MTGSAHTPALRRVARALPAVAGVAGLILLLAGCAEVVSRSPERVSVDTASYGLGEILPGMRQWMGWLAANEHCAAQGKSPELEDMKGTVVTYRCAPR